MIETLVPPPGMAPIDVILLTGFLGTGKTSLIRAYLEQGDPSRTGVIVNEAGDTGFDGIQIAQASGDQSAIRMLGNGCLCCEAPDDLAQAVQDLVARHLDMTGAPSERIIVEASGLARPGALLRQFAALRGWPLRLHVVSTVDATLAAHPDRHGEVAAQWAAASTLVLTQADRAGDGGRAALAMAQAINPLARIVAQGSRHERAAQALAGSQVTAQWRDVPSTGHGAIRAITLRQKPEANWDQLSEWLDNLSGLGGERVLRVKGLLRPDGDPRAILVQAVGTTFAAPQPIGEVEGHRAHVVLIGENVTPDWLAGIEPFGLFEMPDTVEAHAHV